MTKFWNPTTGRNPIFLTGPGSTEIRVHCMPSAPYRIFLCPRWAGRCCGACDAAALELKETGKLASFRAYSRRVFPVIDLDAPDLAIKLYLAPASVWQQMEAITGDSFSIHREGRGLLTRSRVYSYHLAPVFRQSLKHFVVHTDQPTLDYVSEKEMDTWFPPVPAPPKPILYTGEFTLIEGYGPGMASKRHRTRNITLSGNRLPNAKDAALRMAIYVSEAVIADLTTKEPREYVSDAIITDLADNEPREYCAQCGRDTSNDFPMGHCPDCRKIGE